VGLTASNLTHLAVALAGLVGLVVLLHLQERLISRHVAHHLGWRAVLVTGWLGVPVHELSHLLAAKLFGHRIVAWRLFDPDPVSGTLGYVRHAYSRRSVWQLIGTFFIGVAPLVAGGAVLAALLAWMLPAAERGELLRRCLSLGQASDPWRSALLLGGLASQLARAIWAGRSALLPLQLYLAICVAHHLAPSRADLAGALPGAALLLVLLAAGAAGAGVAGVSIAGLLAALVPLGLLLALSGLLLGGWAMLAATLGRMSRPLQPRRAGR